MNGAPPARSASKPVRGPSRFSRRSAETGGAVDSRFTTGSRGLTNARTKIVGERTGFLADAIIAMVRAVTSVRGAVAQVLGRVASVVTPLGWVMVFVAPVSLGFGYGLGWIELVAVGYAMLAGIVIAVVYLIGRSPIAIVLTVPHDRVVVGEPAVGEVRVANPGRRRALGVTVEVPVGPGLAEVALPSLRRGAAVMREFAIPTNRRGVVDVGPVRTVRADPIGIIRRELVWAERSQLFVHPRTIGIPSMSTGFIRDLEGNPTRDLATNDVSFHALREYMPGDERRNIHWKTTARTGTYMVRQFEETRRSHLVVVLSLAVADYADDGEFELAVSVAGSLGTRAIRDARTVTVVVGAITPAFAKRKVFAVHALSTRTRSRLLDGLAVVERSEATLDITDVARVAGEQSSAVSVAFLVCGSSVTARDLRAAATKFAAGVEVVAVVCDPDRTPGLRRVAGLSVLTIGYLEDLHQALARSAAV